MGRENAAPTADGTQLTELARRAAAFLADATAATVPEFARALRVRDADVREVLRADPRFARATAVAGRSRQARPWTLAENSSRPAEKSSRALNGVGAAGMPRGTLEAIWWLPLLTGHPRSVGEAIACAERQVL